MQILQTASLIIMPKLYHAANSNYDIYCYKKKLCNTLLPYM